MPQLARESLSCVGGSETGSKVACECDTAAVEGSDADAVAGGQCSINVISAHADGRAESRRTSWAWSGLAGAVLERGGSTKGSSNPKAAAEAEARKGAARPRRPPAAVVIGVLPAGKMAVQQRRSPVLGRGWRRPAGGARVFASEAVETEEPSSPKVSCFGAVRSESRVAAPAVLGEEERGGCWASITAALRDLCRSDDNRRECELPASVTAALRDLCRSDDNRRECELPASVTAALRDLCRSDDSRRECELPASESKSTVEPESPTVGILPPPQPVPGLGDVKRLASRRWPEGLAADQGRRWCPV